MLSEREVSEALEGAPPCRKQLAGSAAGTCHQHLVNTPGVCAVTAEHVAQVYGEIFPIPKTEMYPIDSLAWLYMYTKHPQLNKVELSSLYVNN